MVFLRGPGAHDVQLQWKKVGSGVATWSSRPSIADGFAGGRTVVVTARHRYIWHSHADSIARIDAEGSWTDVPDTSLEFTLPEVASLRFLYSMTVRSDQIDGQNGECAPRHPVSGLPTGWPAGTLRRCRGPLLLLPHFLINALHAHIFETQAYLDALATPYRRG